MSATRNTTVFENARATYRSYPRPFWILMSGTFIDRFGSNLILPYLAVYVAQRFHAQLAEVGIVFTIFAISGGIGNLLAGALADRFGRRFSLVLGMAGAATARVALGLAPDLPTVYLFAAFAGLFGAIGWPAQIAMTADLLGGERRADGFGIQRMVINATFALGPMIGGLVAPVTGYLLLFVLDAITSYVVALIVFRGLPETRPEARAGQPENSFAATMAGYARVARDGTFMLFVGVAILAVTAYLQMSTTLSLFLINVERLPASFYGALVMLNALMVVGLQFPITRWISKRPPLLVMLAGTALYLVGFGAYGVVAGIPLFVAAMVLITFGEMLFIPTSQAVIALFSPVDMRARYVATERLTWIVAQAVGPLAAGVIMDRFDPRWVWYGCAILCSISMVGFLALHLSAGTRIAARMETASPRPLPDPQTAAAD